MENSVGKLSDNSTNSFLKQEQCNKLKLKYSKNPAPKNDLDGSKVRILKYKSKDIIKLKKKYTSIKSTAHKPFSVSQLSTNNYKKEQKELPINVNDMSTSSTKCIDVHKQTKGDVKENSTTLVSCSDQENKVISRDETPIKINAFQFMMNSRHKVIGSNSEGKEKTENVISSSEFSEKKVKLNKRKDAFEEWAKKKGSLKRQYNEDQQEKYVVDVLNKRAKRLKEMLSVSDSNDETIKICTNSKKTKNRQLVISDSESSNDAGDFSSAGKSETPKVNQATLFNGNKSSSREKMRQSLSLKTKTEDDNCINPLSPDPHIEDVDDEDEIFPEKNTPASSIECKTTPLTFTPRTWRMKVKLFEKHEKEIEIDNDDTDDEDDDDDSENLSLKASSNSSGENCEPRQIKVAPLYVKISKKLAQATVEEKRIFLHSGIPSQMKKVIVKQKNMDDLVCDVFPKISHEQQRTVDATSAIFWNLPTTSLNLTEKETDFNIETKGEFINVGSFTECKSVVNKLSNIQYLHKSPVQLPNITQLISDLKREYPLYPICRTFRLLNGKHNKQNTAVINLAEQSKNNFKKETLRKPKTSRFKKKIETLNTDNGSGVELSVNSKNNEEKILNTETSMWTEKYKPECHEDIIGNINTVNDLKSWLESWLSFSEYQKTSKKRQRMTNNVGSDSDDFCCSDDETRSSDGLPQNLLLLLGPHGSGKTSTVCALCHQLNINIIEINASSRRSGKRILNELQEATQSHQVKNTDQKAASNFFQKHVDSKCEQEESSNKILTLLLIEDVDIVFEDQDDGFTSALVTLVSTSKRPIIFTSADPKSLYLQKFLSQHRVLMFHALSTKTLGPWLRILCLIEGVQVSQQMIDTLLQWNQGDMRKTLLQLEFWTRSGGDSLTYTHPDKQLPTLLRDESASNIIPSSLELRDLNHIHNSCVRCFVPYYERDKHNCLVPYPVNLGVLWSHISTAFETCNYRYACSTETMDNSELINNNIQRSQEENTDDSSCEQRIANSPLLFSGTLREKNVCASVDLNAAVNIMNSMAFADAVNRKYKFECDFEPTCNYWETAPIDSLSLLENMSMFNDGDNLSEDLVHWLIENSLKSSETLINKIQSDGNLMNPMITTDPDKIRWQKKQHSAMKEMECIIPPACVLDRQATCVDYQPLLRTIARVEQLRFANNSKRKNRFYHYFKSCNIHLTDSVCSVLCNTLAPKNGC